MTEIISECRCCCWWYLCETIFISKNICHKTGGTFKVHLWHFSYFNQRLIWFSVGNILSLADVLPLLSPSSRKFCRPIFYERCNSVRQQCYCPLWAVGNCCGIPFHDSRILILPVQGANNEITVKIWSPELHFYFIFIWGFKWQMFVSTVSPDSFH